MNLRNIFLSGLMAAGLVAAQTSTPATPSTGGPGTGWHRGGMGQLQLTDAQKTQAHQIFQDARTASQPIQTQMQTLHQQLAAAAKGGAPDAQIDQIANQAAPLSAQLMSIHAKAFAKFYNILTPDQKAKVDAMGDRFMMGGPGMMMRHGPHTPAANQ